MLIGGNMAPHFAIRQKDTAFSADIDKSAHPVHGNHVDVSQLPFPHLGKLHARRDPVLGIEVELDLDLIANGNRRCHLVLMKENIIAGIPRSSIKKNALVIHAHGRKFHDIANAVTANGLDAGRFFFREKFLTRKFKSQEYPSHDRF